MQEVKAPIIGIDHHRLTTDGVLRTITPSKLYSEIEIDDLYFVAIGGAFALVVASLYCTANS